MEHNPGFDNDGHDYIRYDSIRNINVPRQIGMPLPFPYAKLCLRVKSIWPKIISHFEKHTKDNPHKVSKIHIRKMEGKSHLFEMNYKGEEDSSSDDVDLLIGARFMVNADISNCFPSIYTHSIPWALLGKEEAKSDLKPRRWFNQFDKAIRSIRNNETNGILIGPHASNLISEIVLVVIDRVLIEKNYRFIRHVDDYTCFCKSFEEAERFLLDLSKELKVYELSLNHKKTRISKLPLAQSKNWVRKLSHYRFKKYKDEGEVFLHKNEIEEYLDSAIELMANENDNTAILNYAIKKISKENMTTETLKLFLAKIHHLVLIYPYLVRILKDAVFDAFQVEKHEIKKISDNLIEEGLRTNQYEMVSFGLFFAIHYQFEVGIEPAIERILSSNDCVLMTLAYVNQKKLGKGLLKFKKKARSIISNNDEEQFWLYIYEILSSSELKGDYKQMKNHKVSFVKSIYS